MNNFFRLLIIAALLVAGWHYRDRLTGFLGEPTTPIEVEKESAVVAKSAEPAAPVRSGATPHPARDARVAAAKAYPGLALPDSALNRRFLALYAEAQRSDPALLAREDWPLRLAERAAIALGGGAMPVSAPPRPISSRAVTPKPLTGSALDRRPGTSQSP
jgi:hypothetical protein